jgi:hypothetical protein
MGGRKRVVRVVAVLTIALLTGQAVEHLRDSSRLAASPEHASPKAPDAEDLGLDGIGRITPVAARLEAANGCAVSLTLTPQPGAMIALDLSAPCKPSERVVLRYSGLSFSAVTSAAGRVQLALPAFERDTLVTGYFEDAEVALAAVDVTDLGGITRFAVEMAHPAQYALRAQVDGLVYVGSAGFSAADAHPRIHVLGTSAVAQPILAQVYDFPSADLAATNLTVEVKITPETCGQTLPMTSLLSQDGAITLTKARVAIPLCGTSGDILVLKNLLPDLTLATPR